MLDQCGGKTYVTALDMIMSYYVMNVRTEMQRILNHGGNMYIRKMPMGFNISTDVVSRNSVYYSEIYHLS